MRRAHARLFLSTHCVPDAGGSGLTEAGVPLHRRSVASFRAADPPTAAGCRQEAFSEVLRHKPVNDRVYAAAGQNRDSGSQPE